MMLFAAITLATAVKYVAAAYAIVWALVLLYVWILRSKYQRLEGEVERLERQVAERPASVAEPERSERITVS
jgi:CcmD family protein